MTGAISVSGIKRIVPNISSIGEYNSGDVDEASKKGTLKDLTTREIHTVDTERITDPLDLTTSELRRIGLDSPTALLQRGVVRLRVELNGETIGAGSGIVISADGLILSVNHVPALGKETGVKPFEMIAGTNVIKSLKSWNELLGQKGEARLIADFPLLPKAEPPSTILTPGSEDGIKSVLSSIGKVKIDFGGKKPATAHSREEDTIEFVSVPLQILAESPGEDLMLGRISVPKQKDPYPFVKITDIVPSQGDFVYSIGHPRGIKHNALALGEVLDPSFDVQKIKKAIEAHGIVLNGVSNVFGGEGIGGSNFVSTIARALSLQFAGIDVEPLVKFLNGAVISTNNIDHGSSGGLLCNQEGEAVGITYLGLLIPFNNSAILRYSAGVLGFNTTRLPLSNVTGSVGMKKAIPFLESQGVSVTRIRDGEPSGIETIQERAARNRARVAMTEAYKAAQPSIADDELERRLATAGFPKEEPEVKDVKSANDGTTQTKPAHYVGETALSSKPTSILSLDIDYNNTNSDEATAIVIEAIIATESNQGGEKVRLEVNPADFNLDTFADEHTKGLVISHLLGEKDQTTLARLQEIQRKVVSNQQRKASGDNGPITAA